MTNYIHVYKDYEEENFILYFHKDGFDWGWKYYERIQRLPEFILSKNQTTPTKS